ncbi:MAG: cupin domain-containing protein, partial [Chloroflexi bacterium]|nr:cupin domain-containing protein [Chloroflexota bacterium]
MSAGRGTGPRTGAIPFGRSWSRDPISGASLTSESRGQNRGRKTPVAEGNGFTRSGTPTRVSPYEEWQQREGVPVYRSYHIESLYTLELGPWARKGGNGAYVNLANQYEDDAFVVEIPPGGQLNPEHHIYEALIFVLAGRGATTVWGKDSSKRTVEWKPGSLFAPPLNMWYQHFNASGTEPARLLAVTRQPKHFELFRSAEFIYNCDWQFAERFAGEEEYFTDPGKRLKRLFWKTNFVPDVRTFQLEEYPERGPGFNMKFTLSENSLTAHVSEFPIATYKKGHRHGAGAHVIIIGGDGYSLLWFEGDKKRQRVNWKDGSILSPADDMYHQHFNAGPTPARYLALRLGGHPEYRSPGQQDQDYWAERRVDQIEYGGEDPAIRAEYEAEIGKHGLKLQLEENRFR